MTDHVQRGPGGRFAPGASPNPKGRPRKEATVNSAILRAANETVTAHHNGRKRKIRKLDATATQLANKGASGDLRASKLLLDMAAKAEVAGAAAKPADLPLTKSDQEILEAFLAEYRAYLERGCS